MNNWLKVLLVMIIGLYISAFYFAPPIYHWKNTDIVIKKYKVRGYENLYLLHYKNKIADIEKLAIAIKIKF